MTDGYGISASSTLVYEENSMSNNQVNQNMLDYYGVHTYHTIEDPNNTYIDHIDCWGKFLSPSKILLREVPVSHPQYNEIENVGIAQYKNFLSLLKNGSAIKKIANGNKKN